MSDLLITQVQREAINRINEDNNNFSAIYNAIIAQGGSVTQSNRSQYASVIRDLKVNTAFTIDVSSSTTIDGNVLIESLAANNTNMTITIKVSATTYAAITAANRTLAGTKHYVLSST